MKKLILIILLLLGGLAYANPPGTFQPLLLNTGPIAATITPTDNAIQSTVSTTHTYAGRTFGVAFTGRVIAVAFGLQPNSATITTCSSTIGGIAATQAIFATQSNRKDVAIYAAFVPTGTTGTIAITCDQDIFGSTISVYSLANIASVTATNTGSNNANPATVALNISAGGVAIGSVADDGAGTYTWTNLSENTDTGFGSAVVSSTASAAFANAQTGLSIQANNSAPSESLPLMATASYR